MAPPPVRGNAALELGDIQGLVARGYGNLPAAAFLLVGMPDGAAPARWLGQLAERRHAGRRQARRAGRCTWRSPPGVSRGSGWTPRRSASRPSSSAA